MRIRDFLAASFISAATAITTPSCSQFPSDYPALERRLGYNMQGEIIGDFTEQESAIIRSSIHEANAKYSLPKCQFYIVRVSLPGEDFGETFVNLSNPEDEKTIGKELFEKLKGKNVIILEGISKISFGVDRRPFGSMYLRGASPETAYERAILHEMGHIISAKVYSEKTDRTLYEIDITRDASSQSSPDRHPCHPSFYTFDYSGSVVQKYDKIWVRKNANETFADIFALQVMNKLGNTGDPGLEEKIEIVEKAINRATK